MLVAAAVYGAAYVWLPGVHGLAGTLLALLLVAVAPGYCFTAMLLSPGRVGGALRVACVAGLSLVFPAIVGPLLHLTPWGLAADTWLIASAAGAVVCGTVATLVHGTVLPSGRRSQLPGPGRTVLLALALALVVVAVGIARYGVEYQPRPEFTQMWLLPGADGSSAVLGLRSYEHATRDYRVDFFSGGKVVATFWPVTLVPGHTYEVTVPVIVNRAQGSLFEAQLYRADRPDEAYRRVTLYLGGGG